MADAPVNPPLRLAAAAFVVFVISSATILAAADWLMPDQVLRQTAKGEPITHPVIAAWRAVPVAGSMLGFFKLYPETIFIRPYGFWFYSVLALVAQGIFVAAMLKLLETTRLVHRVLRRVSMEAQPIHESEARTVGGIVRRSTARLKKQLIDLAINGSSFNLRWNAARVASYADSFTLPQALLPAILNENDWSNCVRIAAIAHDQVRRDHENMKMEVLGLILMRALDVRAKIENRAAGAEDRAARNDLRTLLQNIVIFTAHSYLSKRKSKSRKVDRGPKFVRGVVTRHDNAISVSRGGAASSLLTDAVFWSSDLEVRRRAYDLVGPLHQHQFIADFLMRINLLGIYDRARGLEAIELALKNDDGLRGHLANHTEAQTHLAEQLGVKRTAHTPQIVMRLERLKKLLTP
jgi:hypothetical protein